MENISKEVEKLCKELENAPFLEVPQEAIDRVKATLDVYWIIREILEKERLPIPYKTTDKIMAEINKKYKIIPKERKIC